MNPAEAVRCSTQNQNLPFFLGLSDINSIPVVVCNWEGKSGGFWYFSRKCGGFFFWNFLKSNQCLLDFVHICLGWLEKIDNEKQARASERTARR
jgi:hypothetical protein